MIELVLFSIPEGTLPWQANLGKIGKMTFIWRFETVTTAFGRLAFCNGRNMAVLIQKYSMAIL